MQKKEQTSSLEASLPKVKPESNDFAANKPHNAHEERGLAEIEQLLKQKIFTRSVTFLYFFWLSMTEMTDTSNFVLCPAIKSKFLFAWISSGF